MKAALTLLFSLLLCLLPQHRCDPQPGTGQQQNEDQGQLMVETLSRDVREAEADPRQNKNRSKRLRERRQRRRKNISGKRPNKSKPNKPKPEKNKIKRGRNNGRLKRNRNKRVRGTKRNKPKGQKKPPKKINRKRIRKIKANKTNGKKKRPTKVKKDEKKKRFNRKEKTRKRNGKKEEPKTAVSSRQLDGWDGPSADIGPVTAGTGQWYQCNFFWYTRDQSLSRTQVQMGNRINRFVKVIEANKANAATAFTEIIDALSLSTSNGTSCNADTGSEALVLFEKLKNCPNTVPTICDVAAIPAYTPEVIKELDVNDPASCLSQSASYGKAYKDCVFKFSMKDHLKVCPCLTDPATPQPPPRSNPACLPKFFDEASKEVTKKKKILRHRKQ